MLAATKSHINDHFRPAQVIFILVGLTSALRGSYILLCAFVQQCSCTSSSTQSASSPGDFTGPPVAFTGCRVASMASKSTSATPSCNPRLTGVVVAGAVSSMVLFFLFLVNFIVCRTRNRLLHGQNISHAQDPLTPSQRPFLPNFLVVPPAPTTPPPLPPIPPTPRQSPRLFSRNPSYNPSSPMRERNVPPLPVERLVTQTDDSHILDLTHDAVGKENVGSWWANDSSQQHSPATTTSSSQPSPIAVPQLPRGAAAPQVFAWSPPPLPSAPSPIRRLPPTSPESSSSYHRISNAPPPHLPLSTRELPALPLATGNDFTQDTSPNLQDLHFAPIRRHISTTSSRAVRFDDATN
jgi:hypothetical protein